MIYILVVEDRIYSFNEILSLEFILVLLNVNLGFLHIHISIQKHKELNEIKDKWSSQSENEIAIPISDVWRVNLNNRGSQVNTSKGHYLIPPEATLIDLEVLKKNSKNLLYELSIDEKNVRITPQMVIGFIAIVGILGFMIIYLLP